MPPATRSTERTGQKQRTRDHLVATVRQLIAGGIDPTADRVAAASGISRTTTYRYFPNQAKLLAAAHPEIEQTTLLAQDAPADPRSRLDLVLDEQFRILHEWEPQLRASLRASLEPGASQPPLRSGRAVAWFEDALVALDKVRAQRLAIAIRATAGIESYIWLRDIAGHSHSDAVEVMRGNALAIYDHLVSGQETSHSRADES